MTEWNAAGYEQISALQQAMAAEVLTLLNRNRALSQSLQVLDLGCGNGHITAQVAASAPQATVLGVDASVDMISFARKHYADTQYTNLRFEVADIRDLGFREEFDTVLSFNALHWIPEQASALRAMYAAMRPGGSAQLRMVLKGNRKSLEDVLEETRRSPNWEPYYQAFHDPYLHLRAEQYAALAEQHQFQIARLDVEDKSWSFGSQAGFFAFGTITFVEWTRKLPEDLRQAFIQEVLERYEAVTGDDHTFRFYQANISLTKA